jgi:putative nucleotidyltransferase with HDIG domain
MSAKHGTIIAVIDGKSYEITQFRDSACSCEGDLALRDFTINALALPVAVNNTTDVIDPTGGVEDLATGVIRGCIDPSKRIVEDPLRILRGIRLGPARGFALETSTEAAMRAHRALLCGVSPERIRSELELILLSDDPRAAFRALRDLEILNVILPEMLPSIGSEQNEWHVEDVFEHTLTVISRAERERIQRWCALFHDLGKPATATVDADGRRHFYGHEKVSEAIALAVMERLRFSTDDTRLIALLVRQHMRPTSVGEAGVRRIMRDLGEAFSEWRRFKWADAAPALDEKVVREELSKFDALVEVERNRPVGSVYSALAVDGNDLIRIGLSPGKELGGILKALHEKVLDDPALNAKDTLLQLAKEMLDAKK